MLENFRANVLKSRISDIIDDSYINSLAKSYVCAVIHSRVIWKNVFDCGNVRETSVTFCH